MKIKSFGANFLGGQIDRINDGFVFLNHELSSGNPDLIYSNDADGYLEAIKEKELYPDSKLILNILDVPFWISDFENHKNRILPLLKRANAVTCISETVQKHIKNYYNLDSFVIYNPIKDICNLQFKRHLDFLFVGRANDSAKRFNLIYQALNGTNNTFYVVGSENPGFGYYVGTVSNKQLNSLYNSSKFLIYPSKYDGLGLPPIEMIVSGGISIVCNDSETSNEFFPDFLKCDPNPISIKNKIIEIMDNYSKLKPELEKLSLEFYNKFNKNQIANNIINVYNKL